MVQASKVQIRSATKLDVPALAGALTESFRTDPWLQWLCPDPERYERFAPAAFAAQIENEYLPQGAVDVAELEDELVGGIMWRVIDPGRHERGPSGAVWPWLRLSGHRARRLVHSFRRFGRLHPPTPHIYLDTIGLVPRAQGHGIASGLIRPCLRAADRGGFPVFLESTKLANVFIYERFGFAPHVLVELPRGPQIWTMVREPRPASA